MKLPSRLIVLALLPACLVAVLGASSQNRELRLISTVWPPFTNQPGQARLALDLVEHALGRLGVTAVTSFADNAQFTNSLVNGPFDGSPAAWRNKEREVALLFSEPYLENRLVLVARRGANVSAQSLAALKGRRIAIVEGYAYGEIDSTGPVFIRSRSEENSISLLLGQAVDYVLMDELVVQYIVDNYPEEARTRLQIGTASMLTRPLHMVLRRELPDAQALIDKFNAQIKLMITDRTYHRLLRVNWIRADVDGDGVAENVASSDQAARQEPQRSYELFSHGALDTAVKKSPQERYFFGGAVYNGWSSVPDRYKVDHLDRPDATHPTARIFTFSWK
jgi:polar amino acid transport system substrate-binding protein